MHRTSNNQKCVCGINCFDVTHAVLVLIYNMKMKRYGVNVRETGLQPQEKH